MKIDKAITEFLIFIVFALVVIFWLGGCTQSSKSAGTYYRLSDGSAVLCKFERQHPCGIELDNCSSGVRYFCQTNVLIVGEQ